MSDIRQALRRSWKNPGFTCLAVLTLGLGIGSVSAILGVINHTLVRPLPFGEFEQLARISEHDVKTGYQGSASLAHVKEIQEQTDVFADIAVAGRTSYHHHGTGHAELLRGLRTSPNILEVLQVKPLLGAGFHPEHAQPGRDNVALISHRLWRRLYGERPDIVGETITLNNQAFEILGVLPPEFRLINAPDEDQIIQPLAPRRHELNNRTRRSFLAIGRLKKDISLDRANAELETVSQRWAAAEPKTHGDWIVQAEGLRDMYVAPQIRKSLGLLFGATGLLLLIASANIANLLLAKLHARSTEISVRASLGASRMRLAKQFLTEAFVLATLGAFAGWAMAAMGSRLFTSLIPPGMPTIPGPDYLGFGIAAFVALSTFILFGAWPAILASRPNLMNILKGGSGTLVSAGRKRLIGGLVAGQIALAVVLLAGAGLMIQSILRILDVPVGFNPRQLAAAECELPVEKYRDDDNKLAFYQNSLREISQLPGVQSAALSIPGSGAAFELEGRPAPLMCEFTPCTMGEFDYFETMQIPLRHGRPLTTEDRDRAVIVNEAFVRTAWPKENPIGKQIRTGRRGAWLEVAGVVADTRPWRHLYDPQPKVYFPLQARSNPRLSRRATCVIRGQGDPMALSHPFREVFHSLDPTIPVTKFRSVEESLRDAYAPHRLYRNLLAAFGAIGLTLAIVGVYGLIAGFIAERTREIGLRMALGATRPAIHLFLFRRGFIWIGLGLVVGLAGAQAATHLLSNMLFEVGPDDPGTFLTVTLLIFVVALLACFLPARRAANIHPMEALRYE